MPSDGSAQRLRVGAELRRLREATGLSGEQVIPFWIARGVVATLHERMISQPADYFFSQLLKTVSASR